MNICWGEVFQVNSVDLRGHLKIAGHARHGGDVVHRFARESLNLRQPLLHFKKPGAAGHSQGFQGWGNRQADGAVRPALIRYHQVGVEGVKATVYAFHGSVITLQIDAGVPLSCAAHITAPSIELEFGFSVLIIEHNFDKINPQDIPLTALDKNS